GKAFSSRLTGAGGALYPDTCDGYCVAEVDPAARPDLPPDGQRSTVSGNCRPRGETATRRALYHLPSTIYHFTSSRSGETGRRAGLKIPFPSGSVGSIPTSGTNRSLSPGGLAGAWRRTPKPPGEPGQQQSEHRQ